MSHFNCLVIHKEEQDIAKLMAPYSDELKVEPYIRETKESCYKEYLRAKSDTRNKPNSFFAKKTERRGRYYWYEF